MEKEKNIFVDFDTLFDTAYGSAKYILSKYPNSKYIIRDAYSWTPYFLKCKVLTRDDFNPITVVLKEEYKDQAETLYEELRTRHWDEVLSKSPHTDIIRLINSGYGEYGYTIYVNCSHLSEQMLMERIKRDWKSEMDIDDAKRFFSMFIYNVDTLMDRVKNVDGKSLYIYYHKPNFINYKEQIPNESVLPLGMTNTIVFIEPYRNLIIPDDCDMTPNDLEVDLNGSIKGVNI